MTDDAEEIELPRYARHIGVARGTVAGSWDATSTGAIAPGAPSRSVGVLSPLAGLLGGLGEPTSSAERPVSAFSYLTLKPPVVERTFERETVTVGPDGPTGDRGDRPETGGQLRVRQLLRDGYDPRAVPRDRGGSPTDDDPRLVTRRVPDDASEPVREVAMHDARPLGEAESGNRAPDVIRDVSVLDTERLTVLERVRERAPSDDRLRAPSVEAGTATSGRRPPAERTQRAAGRLGLPRPQTMTTLQQSPASPPGTGPETVELRVREAGGPTQPPGDSGPHDGPASRGDTGSDPDIPTPTGRDRPPVEVNPELTVVTSRPTPGLDRTPGPEPDGSLVNARSNGDGRSADEDRPENGIGRESAPRRPTQDTTMPAVLKDTAEMNRLVDRIYDQFQRKERIERERRGL